ncbi:MAG TPA: hypothetical protein VNX28_17185 [Gemmataceae bacterium]|jgi:hypothetical protein|nr:hypothetical protein [Gemmataceae bacterium]
MDDDANPAYKVDHLPRVLHQLHQLSAQARKRGISKSLVTALKKARDFCREQPKDWGDPVRNTILEGGIVYRGICKPVVVEYAVFDNERAVVILSVYAFPGSGFDE